MKITEFLDSKNRGRKIKMFVAQEYYSGSNKRNNPSCHYWRAFFDKKSFSYMIQNQNIKEDFVEIIAVNDYKNDSRYLSLMLKYKDETFEHYEPLYSLTPDRIELDDNGKIIASYFTTWADAGSSERYKNKIAWKESKLESDA